MQGTKHNTASRDVPRRRLLATPVPSLHNAAHPQRNFSNAATGVLRDTGRAVGEHDEAVGGGRLVVVLHLQGA